MNNLGNMANWCSNFVTFTGRSGNIEKLYSDIERLKQEQIEHGNGVSLLSHGNTNRYMFALDIQSHDKNELIINFETKWYISIEDFKVICDKYKVNISCDYEEPGMGIYGNYQYLYGGLLDKVNEVPDDVMQSVVEDDDDGTVTYNMKTYGCMTEFVEEYLSKNKIKDLAQYEKENRSPD
jgi:hypothetical protein